MFQRRLLLPLLVLALSMVGCGGALLLLTSPALSAAAILPSAPPTLALAITPTVAAPMPTPAPAASASRGRDDPQYEKIGGVISGTQGTPQKPPFTQMGFTLATDAFTLVGQPGNTVTYTLTLKNTGTVTDTYQIWGRKSYSSFSLEGLYYDHDSFSYDNFLSDVGPQKQSSLSVRVHIPVDAANGMVNITSLKATGSHTGSAGLELTTVVAAPTSIEQIGHVGILPRGVFVQGNYAYVAAGSDGLRIVDVSDPATPTEVGAYYPPTGAFDSVNEVKVAGRYAYLAAGLAGLRVVDVSDPARPFEIGAYGTPTGSADRITVDGNYAHVIWGYCFDYNCGSSVHTLDISSPAAPRQVSVYATGSVYAGIYSPRDVYAVAVADKYAYLGTRWGLQVVNVANPASPVEVRFPGYSSDEFEREIVISNHYAYVAAANGLHIMDVSNPVTPTEVGVCKTTQSVGYASTQGLAVAGNYAYIVDSLRKLYVIDISDPANPQQVSGSKLLAEAKSVVVADMPSNPGRLYAYLPSSAGLRIMDVSNPTQPEEVGVYGAPALVEDVAIGGQYAYVADAYNGLYVMDISRPTTPTQVSLYNKRGGACSVEAVGHYAYVVSNCVANEYWNRPEDKLDSGLYVLDLSNPAAPVEVAYYDLAGGKKKQWKKLEASGSRLYMADGEGWLYVWDISNPAAPTKIDSLTRKANTFVLANDYLYVLPPNAYVITNTQTGYTSNSRLDILDPVSLATVGSYRLPEKYPAEGIFVAGQRAYIYWLANLVTLHNDGWVILNLSDPTAPAMIEDSDKPVYPWGPQGIAASDHLTYLANGEIGLRILDVSDPVHPAEVDTFGAPGFAYDVAAAGDYIYLANGSGGLYILRYLGAGEK